jgi:hypothetical protein
MFDYTQVINTGQDHLPCGRNFYLYARSPQVGVSKVLRKANMPSLNSATNDGGSMPQKSLMLCTATVYTTMANGYNMHSKNEKRPDQNHNHIYAGTERE